MPSEPIKPSLGIDPDKRVFQKDLTPNRIVFIEDSRPKRIPEFRDVIPSCSLDGGENNCRRRFPKGELPREERSLELIKSFPFVSCAVVQIEPGRYEVVRPEEVRRGYSDRVGIVIPRGRYASKTHFHLSLVYGDYTNTDAYMDAVRREVAKAGARDIRELKERLEPRCELGIVGRVQTGLQIDADAILKAVTKLEITNETPINQLRYPKENKPIFYRERPLKKPLFKG